MDTVASMINPQVHNMYPKNLWNMLNQICDGPYKTNRIFYLDGEDPTDLKKKKKGSQTYEELRKDAWDKSFKLRNWQFKKHRKGDGELNRVIVLHFDNYYENITWFWACIACALIPCISLPFKGNFSDQATYVNGLRKLLEEPIFLTNGNTVQLYKQFARTGIKVYKVSQLDGFPRERERVYSFPGGHQIQDEIAMIMLTSGSTGVSKAVAIKHKQIIYSLRGKQEKFATRASDKFLSWTDFSHVANLLEIHLHALQLGAMQVHVPASEVIASPVKLLELVDKYRISCTFAPNFFLNSLFKDIHQRNHPDIQEDWFDKCERMDMNDVLAALISKDRQEIVVAAARMDFENRKLYDRDDTLQKRWDLGCLRALISGGEANIVDTCVKLTDILQQYNAPFSFIRPGFGMTETCAGCIYSTSCPKFDTACGLEFASLGEPTITTKIRIMGVSGEDCGVNEVGELQLSGLAVFDGYYNDRRATAEAFTTDGWFASGDLARVDELGQLHIEGRVKDTLVINGVNHYPHAIEAALEDAKIEGMTPSFTAIFPFRPTEDNNNPGTECLCIVYVPTYDHFNVKARIETHTAISKTVVLYSGIRPYKILPLSDRVLTKSVLGKLSRSGIRACFESGGYIQYEREDDRLIKEYQRSVFTAASTKTEKAIIQTYKVIFSAAVPDIGTHCNLFNLGVGSGDLLRMRVNLMEKLKIDFPITIFFAHPTIGELAAALDKLNAKVEYNPVVVLQPKTDRMTKLPIFFIHPGMGEILIFMNLARHIHDRPVYALRARGFDGEPFFKDLDEMIECYHTAIKKTQPKGPYALAGYSFGSILTWEIAKRMIAAGDEVKFLGTFDQAPFLKDRSRGYDWYECVVSVAFFLGLMEENHAYAQLTRFRTMTHEELLAHIMTSAPPEQLRALGLDQYRLERWADLALAMKKTTWDYDPEGQVPHMDIFWTVPLLGIVKAKTTEEWRDKYIHQWDQLVHKPEYHFVGGGHRTMIKPPHLIAFQKTFKEALERRGV